MRLKDKINNTRGNLLETYCYSLRVNQMIQYIVPIYYLPTGRYYLLNSVTDTHS